MNSETTCDLLSVSVNKRTKKETNTPLVTAICFSLNSHICFQVSNVCFQPCQARERIEGRGQFVCGNWHGRVVEFE